MDHRSILLRVFIRDERNGALSRIVETWRGSHCREISTKCLISYLPCIFWFPRAIQVAECVISFIHRSTDASRRVHLIRISRVLQLNPLRLRHDHAGTFVRATCAASAALARWIGRSVKMIADDLWYRTVRQPCNKS